MNLCCYRILNIEQIKVPLQKVLQNMKAIQLFFLTSFLFLISGCTGGYSLTGASIAPDVKTISIQTFPNNASLVQPQLSQLISDGIRNRFRTQTSLTLVDYDGDLNIRGEITNYTTSPTAIQGNDQAGLNRLTITIRVRFVNTKDSKANFDQSFSRYADYSSRSEERRVGKECRSRWSPYH